METSRAFMPLVTEFGRLGEGFCYRHVAPNGTSVLQRQVFNRAKQIQSHVQGTLLAPSEAGPDG
jgi:hypothetical protein